MVVVEVQVRHLVAALVIVGRHVQELPLPVELFPVVVRVITHSPRIGRRFLRSRIRTRTRGLITGGPCLALRASTLGTKQLRQVLPLHHLLSEFIPIHVRRTGLLIGKATAHAVLLHEIGVLRACG